MNSLEIQQILMTICDIICAQTSTFMQITIMDENDNPPVFDEPKQKVTMDENSNLQLCVSARDADSGENGFVRYSLESGGNGKSSVAIVNLCTSLKVFSVLSIRFFLNGFFFCNAFF